jgi:translation initiation factor 4E
MNWETDYEPHVRLYNNIVEPSKLPQKANYYLFKESIIPAWEDAANKDGGKWSIQLPKDKNRSNVDKMWLYTVRCGLIRNIAMSFTRY